MPEQEDKGTEYGLVKIHKNVISQIASVAAMEVDGVSRISRGWLIKLLGIFTGGRIRKEPIKIELKENNEVALTIPLVVKYGFNIPNVAVHVQENVKKAIEQMTGLYPMSIHIKVKGVEAGVTK